MSAAVEIRLPLPALPTWWDRFMAKVRFPTDPAACWTWIGKRNDLGYGGISTGGRAGSIVNAHRLLFKAVRHDLADDVDLHHVCRNPSCVNPWHLQPVARREHVLLGDSPAAANARKTHCDRGHSLSGANLYINPARGARVCRECARAHDRLRRR